MAPPLRLVNSQREIAESGARWLCKSTAEQIAVEYRQSGRWLLAVDGFMDSGKSTLVTLLAEQLRCGVLSLDETLPEEPSDLSLSYVERLDASRISSAIARLRADGEGIVEGVCLRSVLAQHGVGLRDVFHVYAASVSVRHATTCYGTKPRLSTWRSSPRIRFIERSRSTTGTGSHTPARMQS